VAFKGKMTELKEKKCVACDGGMLPLKGDTINIFKDKVDDAWQVIEEHHIEREFTFNDFKEALAFTNKIGAIAEEEGHHPDILLTYGKVKVTIYTHKIGGLHENDFIVAAKIDEVLRK